MVKSATREHRNGLRSGVREGALNASSRSHDLVGLDQPQPRRLDPRRRRPGARRGTSTNHYTLRLPVSVLIDNAIKQQRSLAGPGTPEEQELQRSRPAAKGKHVTIHLWMNDRDLVLRQEMRGADLVEGMGGKAAGGVVRITYSRWGTPISIIPPPSAETKPVEDVE